MLPPLRDRQQINVLLRTMLEDTNRYPWGTHRMLDYFRTAVHMFISEVRREYRTQAKMASRNGKAITRFTWRNKGELAVCFACCCDMLKLFYDSIRPGPMRPMWDVFVHQLVSVLMTGSRIPSAVLSANTYHTKFMDWQKGGTRYAGESSTANVRFPSVSERQVKVETFLRSGAGYNIQAVVVDPSTISSVPSKESAARSFHSLTATPNLPSSSSPASSTANRAPNTGGGGSTATSPSSPSGGPLVPAFRPGVKGSVPLRLPAKNTSGSGGGSMAQPAAPRQIPEEMRHLYWLSMLAHVKGGEPTSAFPDSRAALMAAFTRVCEMAKTLDEMAVLVKIIRASSPGIQTIFERLGGLITFRNYASSFITEGDSERLMMLVDTVARLRCPCWGRISQETWCTDMRPKRGIDLQWLRQLTLIPTAKRAAWGALLLMMEERFIFTLPLEQQLEARQSTGATASTLVGSSTSPLAESKGLRDAAADNKVQGLRGWKWPRINTFNAKRLPEEWRASPLFLSDQEQKELHAYLDAKQKYLEEEQERWRSSIQSLMAAQRKRSSTAAAGTAGLSASTDTSTSDHRSDSPEGEDMPIPLWYDPLQVLGIQPPLKSVKREENTEPPS